ncbi:polysaccharide biosynthesis tyrosine autokinase [Rhizobium sp. B230/85]|uniref:polysaccharide biosynthesis tyrosine autokinase n=1 Tax=unclassified Rhizobium TaxID=2613769 RepID=UPI001ADBBEBC|nr:MULTISPECIES: polysaccharide biosynthesis tyrosine autokinase [unclassified Rhizobium]MBO9134163.1 polysaccharide biosynthesis tyrosine autokinase [Rhizobium sp. B209b/85]QXZ96709.1 polysaccharide biosynthesis tyrosine autokinase [Rhizobium sp. B230/85]
MLSPKKSNTDSWAGFDHDEISEIIDLDRILAAARRQWKVVAAAIGAFIVLGIVYLLLATPQYTANTSVLIDHGTSTIVNQMTDTTVPPGSVDEEGNILTQVEVLRSDTIAVAVIQKLDLLNNPDFVGKGPSWISKLIGSIKIKSWLGLGTPPVPVDEAEVKLENAAAQIERNMLVERVNRSFVLSISYTSPSPKLAQQIADGIADAYLVDKLNSKYDATRRASDWLQDRIEELRKKSLASDLAVQKFRSDNGLVETSGQLVSDQQLSQLNTALTTAQGDTAAAQAKYDRVESIIQSKNMDAVVSDVLGSTTINDLRKKYLDASKMQADIARRLGPDHEQAVRLRGEMQEYQRLMFEELGRIAQSYRNDLDVAKAREKSLADSVASATTVSATASDAQVQLRELERTRDTYRDLYQSFLTRYQQASQQESFPITEARVITKATFPIGASKPKKIIVLALSIILGGIVGGGIGVFREFRDRFFRTGDQVRDSLHQEYLGIAPIVKPVTAAEIVQDHPRSIRQVNGVSNYVAEHPLSAFAETMRSAKIAIDVESGERMAKVVGIVSSLPGEGKSTISMNFAQLLAMQGARTLLIDADLRNPGATRSIGRHAEAGLLEALLERRPIQDLLLIDQKTKLAFLPAIVKRRVPHSSELLSSPAMNAMLDMARANFDYIVIDLPPLGPVVDARAISPNIDAFLFVVEWGKTSRKVVRSMFTSEPAIASKCAGVILNKVDTEKMKLYRAHGSSEYYYSRYTSYYHEN